VSFPTALCEELAPLMIGKGRDDLVFTDQRGGVLRRPQLACAGVPASGRQVPGGWAGRAGAHRWCASPSPQKAPRRRLCGPYSDRGALAGVIHPARSLTASEGPRSAVPQCYKSY
jgi:hypothetical protein